MEAARRRRVRGPRLRSGRVLFFFSHPFPFPYFKIFFPILFSSTFAGYSVGGRTSALIFLESRGRVIGVSLAPSVRAIYIFRSRSSFAFAAVSRRILCLLFVFRIRPGFGCFHFLLSFSYVFITVIACSLWSFIRGIKHVVQTDRESVHIIDPVFGVMYGISL